MATRKYPYIAWHLTPACAVREVKVIRQYWGLYQELETGKNAHSSQLFDSKKLAIAGGRGLLAAQEMRVARSAELIAKRRKTLDKAEAENG